MKKTIFASLAALIASVAAAQVYQYYGPANGIQVNTGNSYQNTAATFSNVAGLWAGTNCGTTTNVPQLNGNCITVSGAVSGANPTASVGITAVNGSATTFLRSDAAPALSQSIAPTWTGDHIFSPASGVGVTVNGVANSPAVTFNGNSTSGQSLGVLIKSGTTSADYALQIQNQAASSTFATVFGDGGVVLGGATGGDQGLGTLNMVGCFVNGVACSTGGAAGANPTGTVGLTAVNGSAGTFMRSDAAPPLSQSITPTWTGVHTFTLPWAVTGTGVLTPTIDNTSASASAISAVYLENSSSDFFRMLFSSAANTTAYLTNGPTGEAGYFYTTGAAPISFGTNGVERIRISSAGNASINAPSSGIAETVNGVAGSFAGSFVGSSTTGQSRGIIVQAGTNSSDHAVIVANSANTVDFFALNGDGSATLGWNGTAATITTSAAGAVAIAAPSSGFPLLVTGNDNSSALVTNDPSPVNGMAALTIESGGTVRGQLGVGPAVMTGAATTDFAIVANTGVLRLGNTSTTFMSFATTGAVAIAAPSSGTTLAITNIAGQNAVTWGDGTRAAFLSSGVGGLGVGSSSSDPLNLITAGTTRMSISNQGVVTINSPSPNNYALNVNGSASSGQSFGELIAGGTTSTDTAFKVQSQSGTAFLDISGVGATTIHTPTASGFIALQVNSIAGQYGLSVTAPNTASNSDGVEILAGTNSTDTGLIVQNAAGTTTNFRVLGNGAITMPQLASSSSAATGSVCWTTGGNLTVDTTVACLSSTRRIKQNIRPIDIGIKTVMKLRPVSYDLKPEYNPKHLGPQVGLIAEDVQKIDPRLIALDDSGQPLGVRYMQMTAVLIKAVQEQQAEIDSLIRRHH